MCMGIYLFIVYLLCVVLCNFFLAGTHISSTVSHTNASVHTKMQKKAPVHNNVTQECASPLCATHCAWGLRSEHRAWPVWSTHPGHGAAAHQPRCAVGRPPGQRVEGGDGLVPAAGRPEVVLHDGQRRGHGRRAGGRNGDGGPDLTLSGPHVAGASSVSLPPGWAAICTPHPGSDVVSRNVPPLVVGNNGVSHVGLVFILLRC